MRSVHFPLALRHVMAFRYPVLFPFRSENPAKESERHVANANGQRYSTTTGLSAPEVGPVTLYSAATSNEAMHTKQKRTRYMKVVDDRKMKISLVICAAALPHLVV